MSYFLKQLRESGFIQHLRSQMKPEDLEVFDKMAKEKMKEYDELWLKLEPIVTAPLQGDNDVGSNESKSESESRFDKKSDNTES